MTRVWLDPRDGSWWQVVLHQGGGSFPRILIFVSEEGDVLSASPDDATPPSELDDHRLCRILDRARDALVRSAVRHAISSGDRAGPGGTGGGRSSAA